MIEEIILPKVKIIVYQVEIEPFILGEFSVEQCLAWRMAHGNQAVEEIGMSFSVWRMKINLGPFYLGVTSSSTIGHDGFGLQMDIGCTLPPNPVWQRLRCASAPNKL